MRKPVPCKADQFRRCVHISGFRIIVHIHEVWV
uniref:Uncharacterized protein n=1 Tax=Arundo donax TaxID=35708 RepID=A0A0A8YPK8_ARUDO